MKVFKFGGASINSADRIRNVGRILQAATDSALLVVISAMGKTTNALEKVAEAFYAGRQEDALRLFEAVKEDHLRIANEFQAEATRSSTATDFALTDFFTEIEWLLHDKPVRPFDYYYDQIVCIGELLSTAVVSQYLAGIGLQNQWIDVRDVLRTDGNFRDAKIDWAVTARKVDEVVVPAFNEKKLIITQGFIGATDENESTTLGREGSDYTAAVFANLLNAESQTIWKDVQGVMNADPKLYPGAVWIKELNYREVIEMAYYGAQVIHPKTVKPLQNKAIPLYVKSFLNPEAEGTCIHHNKVEALPPIIVYKPGQVLISLSTRDYAFAGEGLSADAQQWLEELRLRPNLTQSAAIGLLFVLDDHPGKVEAFALRAADAADASVRKGFTLLTVRHYDFSIVNELVGDRKIVLQQQTQETVQLLLEAEH